MACLKVLAVVGVMEEVVGLFSDVQMAVDPGLAVDHVGLVVDHVDLVVGVDQVGRHADLEECLPVVPVALVVMAEVADQAAVVETGHVAPASTVAVQKLLGLADLAIEVAALVLVQMADHVDRALAAALVSTVVDRAADLAAVVDLVEMAGLAGLVEASTVDLAVETDHVAVALDVAPVDVQDAFLVMPVLVGVDLDVIPEGGVAVVLAVAPVTLAVADPVAPAVAAVDFRAWAASWHVAGVARKCRR